MTQRSSRSSNGPWRVVAAEAAATAAASSSGRSVRNGGERVPTTNGVDRLAGGNFEGIYSDESRFNGKNGSTLLSSSSLSKVAMNKPSSTTSSTYLPSSANNSTISNQRHQQQHHHHPQQQRSTTPVSLVTTTSSSTSMYHHHHENHYSFNNTGYPSNNGSISKSAMTAAAAAALASTSAPSSTAGTTVGNGTIIDTSDEDDDDDDDDYSTPIRRTGNYKNNIITASSGGTGTGVSSGSSSSKLKQGNEEGPSSSSSSSAAATAAKLDRYGFFINDPQSRGLTEDMNNLSLVEMTRKRESKWLHMFTNWDEYIHKKWKKLRARCRKGIPDSVRGKAWFYLCAGHKQKQRNPELFIKLDGQPGDEKINDEIRKDLNRQFPSHEMFAQENGSGQEDLYRILKAFSVIKPDIGYCQGQAPLASVLLMQMPAEDAFWCLLQICDHYVPGYFSPGLEAIQLHGQMLSSFVKKFHPPIYKLFKKQKIDPVLYMTEWFMCFFSRTLSWPCVLRVWDMFFCEGIVVIFKVAIILIASVLGRHEDRVKCVSAYETLFALKNIPSKFVTEEFLIERVINMDLSEKDLQKEHKEQSLKRKKEKERLSHERSKSTTSIKGTATGNNSTNSKGSIRNRSRSKSDF